VTYEQQKAKWAKRRQAIYDAHKVKERPIKDVANAYRISIQRVHKIISEMEAKK
jgi:Mor family transcriptional regulator